MSRRYFRTTTDQIVYIEFNVNSTRMQLQPSEVCDVLTNLKITQIEKLIFFDKWLLVNTTDAINATTLYAFLLQWNMCHNLILQDEDKKLTFALFTKLCIQRSRQNFKCTSDWSLSDWGCALAGEAGEACNKIKKLRRGEKISVESIGSELADTITYACILLHYLGLDVEDAIIDKFNEVSTRVKSPFRIKRKRLINGE